MLVNPDDQDKNVILKIQYPIQILFGKNLFKPNFVNRGFNAKKCPPRSASTPTSVLKHLAFCQLFTKPQNIRPVQIEAFADDKIYVA